MDVPHTWVGLRTHGEKWRKPAENKELDLTKISLSKRYTAQRQKLEILRNLSDQG